MEYYLNFQTNLFGVIGTITDSITLGLSGFGSNGNEEEL